MKKNVKRTLYVGMAIAIAIIFCLQAGAITKDKNNMTNTHQRIPFELKNLGRNIGTTGLDGNILLSPNSPEDDHLPGISKGPGGNIAVVWTHEISLLDSNIGLAYSTDGGGQWNSRLFEIEGFQYYADIGYFEGSKYEGPAWDGFWIESLEVIDEGGTFILITDLSDEDTYEPYGWTDGSRPGATYLNFEDDMWYLMTYFNQIGPVVGMINDDQGMYQGIELWWMAAGDDLGSIVYNWDAESALDTAPGRDIDLAPIHDSDPAWTQGDFFYLVSQHDNEENGRAEIVYKRCVPVDESDIEYVAEQFYLESGGTTYDAAHPDVAAAGDSVAVVYMVNDNIFGDWDIKCSYSDDRGQTWGTSMVANTPQIDETYPAVCISGGNVICAYIKEGNLYLVVSEDGGATWGEPEKINEVDGAVIAEENSVSMNPAGLVWTDNRNGDKDIYYEAIAAGGASIIVSSVSGGIGVSAVIENVGTADATDVHWSINLEGGLVIVGGSAEGTISAIPVGGSATVKIPFVLGLGGVTIKVAADGATKTASGTVLLFFVTGVS